MQVHCRVNLFIALAPVSIPRGFSNPIAESLARARPDFIFLIFGKRALLPFTLFWRNYLPRDKVSHFKLTSNLIIISTLN